MAFATLDQSATQDLLLRLLGMDNTPNYGQLLAQSGQNRDDALRRVMFSEGFQGRPMRHRDIRGNYIDPLNPKPTGLDAFYANNPQVMRGEFDSGARGSAPQQRQQRWNSMADQQDAHRQAQMQAQIGVLNTLAQGGQPGVQPGAQPETQPGAQPSTFNWSDYETTQAPPFEDFVPQRTAFTQPAAPDPQMELAERWAQTAPEVNSREAERGQQRARSDFNAFREQDPLAMQTPVSMRPNQPQRVTPNVTAEQALETILMHKAQAEQAARSAPAGQAQTAARQQPQPRVGGLFKPEPIVQNHMPGQEGMAVLSDLTQMLDRNSRPQFSDTGFAEGGPLFDITNDAYTNRAANSQHPGFTSLGATRFWDVDAADPTGNYGVMGRPTIEQVSPQVDWQGWLGELMRSIGIAGSRDSDALLQSLYGPDTTIGDLGNVNKEARDDIIQTLIDNWYWNKRSAGR